MCIFLSICSSLYISVCSSLSLCVCVCLYLFLSIHLSLSLSLSTYLFVFPPLSNPICISLFFIVHIRQELLLEWGQEADDADCWTVRALLVAADKGKQGTSARWTSTSQIGTRMRACAHTNPSRCHYQPAPPPPPPPPNTHTRTHTHTRMHARVRMYTLTHSHTPPLQP